MKDPWDGLFAPSYILETYSHFYSWAPGYGQAYTVSRCTRRSASASVRELGRRAAGWKHPERMGAAIIRHRFTEDYKMTDELVLVMGRTLDTPSVRAFLERTKA